MRPRDSKTEPPLRASAWRPGAFNGVAPYAEQRGFEAIEARRAFRSEKPRLSWRTKEERREVLRMQSGFAPNREVHDASIGKLAAGKPNPVILKCKR